MDHELFSVVPRFPAGSLLAQLGAGEGAPSLFPPSLGFGGPGAPPPAAAEVNTGLPPVTLEKTSWSCINMVAVVLCKPYYALISKSLNVLNADVNMEDSLNHLWELALATIVDVEPTVAQLSAHMHHQQRATFRDKLDRYVHKPDRDLILALRGGQVLGLVCVIDQAEFPSSLPEQTVERLRNFACSTQLLVHPGLRKQGIGSRLQLRAEQWARERGRAGLWLVTHRMADWYRRHFGYEEVGRTDVKNAEKIVMAKEF